MPGVQRTAGSVVHPGGGAQVGIPAPTHTVSPHPGYGYGHNGNGNGPGRPGRGGNRGGSGSVLVGVPYPVYVGGGYVANYDPYDAPPQQQQQQQPNVVVVYPQQAPPVIINQYGPGDPNNPGMTSGAPSAYPAYPAPAPIQSQTSEPPAAEATHFLIAFKDHTIYSAVAYWVEGETLHYFTNGSTHNQVSLSLIDRDLTTRLNRDSGVEVKLPAAR